MFALDSSSDVTDKQWDQQKNFAQDVLKSFNVSPDGTHAGLVAYSTIPSIEMKLDEKNSRDDVLSSLRTLPRDVGNRNLVILLEMAKFEVFTASGGMRTHAPKVWNEMLPVDSELYIFICFRKLYICKLKEN